MIRFDQSIYLFSFFLIVVILSMILMLLRPFPRLDGPSALPLVVGLGYVYFYVGKFLIGGRNTIVVGPDGLTLIARRRIKQKFVWANIKEVRRVRSGLLLSPKQSGATYTLTNGYLGSDELTTQVTQTAIAFHREAVNSAVIYSDRDEQTGR